jgi:hypothetical protein
MAGPAGQKRARGLLSSSGSIEEDIESRPSLPKTSREVRSTRRCSFGHFDGRLVPEWTVSGAGAEGLAGYGPVAVILALEIGDHDVIVL